MHVYTREGGLPTDPCAEAASGSATSETPATRVAVAPPTSVRVARFFGDMIAFLGVSLGQTARHIGQRPNDLECQQ